MAASFKSVSVQVERSLASTLLTLRRDRGTAITHPKRWHMPVSSCPLDPGPTLGRPCLRLMGVTHQRAARCAATRHLPEQ